MDQATIEVDPKKRSQLYAEIQKLVVEAAPLVWTHEINFATVLDKRYRDVIVSPLGLFSSFDRAWRE